MIALREYIIFFTIIITTPINNKLPINIRSKIDPDIKFADFDYKGDFCIYIWKGSFTVQYVYNEPYTFSCYDGHLLVLKTARTEYLFAS